jgi:hypothetical protein
MRNDAKETKKRQPLVGQTLIFKKLGRREETFPLMRTKE